MTKDQLLLLYRMTHEKDYPQLNEQERTAIADALIEINKTYTTLENLNKHFDERLKEAQGGKKFEPSLIWTCKSCGFPNSPFAVYACQSCGAVRPNMHHVDHGRSAGGGNHGDTYEPD